MDLASVVAALASVGVRVSGSAPNSSVQVDSSRACPPGLAGPEPSGTIHDLGQHFQTFSLSLIPLVHVVNQEETGYGGGHQSCVSSPLSWGMWDAYAVCGASMCPWDMGGGGVGAHWGPPVLSSMASERIQRSEKGGEAGSDPRGHLWVTWGVYLWAGKPPLADIILSHPPDLT